MTLWLATQRGGVEKMLVALGWDFLKEHMEKKKKKDNLVKAAQRDTHGVTSAISLYFHVSND